MVHIQLVHPSMKLPDPIKPKTTNYKHQISNKFQKVKSQACRGAASSRRVHTAQPLPWKPTVTRSPSTITGTFRWPLDSASILCNARGSSITLTYSTDLFLLA
jgi:hypothetical protein